MVSSAGLRRVDRIDAEARGQHAAELLRRLNGDVRTWELELSAVTALIVDALLSADAAALGEIADPLRHAEIDAPGSGEHGTEISGYLAALLSAVDVALERLPDDSEFALVADSHAHRMLSALETDSLTSGELVELLHTSDSQISRVGRTLLAAGLVHQRRAGRSAIWQVTPRGRQLARGVSERSRSAR